MLTSVLSFLPGRLSPRHGEPSFRSRRRACYLSLLYGGEKDVAGKEVRGEGGRWRLRASRAELLAAPRSLRTAMPSGRRDGGYAYVQYACFHREVPAHLPPHW